MHLCYSVTDAEITAAESAAGMAALGDCCVHLASGNVFLRGISGSCLGLDPVKSTDYLYRDTGNCVPGFFVPENKVRHICMALSVKSLPFLGHIKKIQN